MTQRGEIAQRIISSSNYFGGKRNCGIAELHLTTLLDHVINEALNSLIVSVFVLLSSNRVIPE